jgi:hypothetical protein
VDDQRSTASAASTDQRVHDCPADDETVSWVGDVAVESSRECHETEHHYEASQCCQLSRGKKKPLVQQSVKKKVQAKSTTTQF